MTDRPIIFSAPMVRALLDGRKTQTRRVYKEPAGSYIERGRVYAMTDGCAYGDAALPYAPGDRLWVREAVRAVEHEDGTDAVEYLADGGCAKIDNTMEAADRWGALFHYRGRPESLEGRKVPPIHMPRWASRLTLTVTKVRVQRVQDMSLFDAFAEGIPEPPEVRLPVTPAAEDALRCAGLYPECDPFAMYQILWNSLHGPDAWDANPWVVALTFTVRKGNIDQGDKG